MSLTPEEKKKLSESDICDLYITPALKQAGWDPFSQIRREVTLTPGPIIVRGNMSSRNKKKKKFADYVLYWEPSLAVGVLEAKDNKNSVGQGMQQALGYAKILEVPSAFSSNGDAFEQHNKVPDTGEDIETSLRLDQFPEPGILWKRYKKYHGIENEEEKLLAQPFHDDGSGKEPRYYQADAINRTIEAVAKGKKRVLLVMATGTGKTYTVFQIIWRLWKAGEAKRVLFLADRNILVDQTLVNDFKPFGSVMTKVSNRKIDPAYEIHLGLYQALTGKEEADKIYKTVSPDFFDLVVVDECHRGSAADDSQWREILDYFSGAIQIGLTATPKETKYISSSTYFGDPVYTYSLKDGILDGFLAPYKVIKIDIDKDIEGWTPAPGAVDDLGNAFEHRAYNQKDMDRILVLNKRTKLVAARVIELLCATDPFSKTIVFCEDIDHAERMRKALVNAAGQLAIDNPEYVRRITGDTGDDGKADLDNFIDPESKFPVIATTSEMLTTGVDAKTCKLIVLDKTISSMTIFKQIIGRGTRVDEDHGKWYFTIMDFKKATENFYDKEFDGEPVVIYEPDDNDPPEPPDPPEDPEEEVDDEDEDPRPGRTKLVVDGVEVEIIAERVSFIGPDGALITESYKKFARKKLREEFSSLDDFIRKWVQADKKKAIIRELEEHGILLENLAEEVGKEFGDFDLLCHVAYDQPPLTRAERVKNVKKRDYFTKYGEQARQVLAALMDKYADEGILSIEDASVLRLEPFDKIGTPVEIIRGIFGGKPQYDQAVRELEDQLYKQAND